MDEAKLNKVLLVEPSFPFKHKSKNHSDFLPIGLLKIASYLRSKGIDFLLIKGLKEIDFNPDHIFITSLFTYWSRYVKEAVTFYRATFPQAKIIVGGIYATLMPDHCLQYTECDEVFIGQFLPAEELIPAYDLVDVDYQIIHGMRGCSMRCPFCGIWRIENMNFKDADKIRKEILFNKVIFYDNNILLNPNIETILEMLAGLVIKGRPVNCECQSGFDGRLLAKAPGLASLLKKARFVNIRLAWDFAYEQYADVQNWIEILEKSGYKRNELFIFMIYNWSFDYQELELKRQKCFEWGVQISDCRYRPLSQVFDNYNPNIKNQTEKDYYIHSNWTDQLIKQFRSDVRKHNICIRHKIKWNEYNQSLERSKSRNLLNTILID